MGALLGAKFVLRTVDAGSDPGPWSLAWVVPILGVRPGQPQRCQFALQGAQKPRVDLQLADQAQPFPETSWRSR